MYILMYILYRPITCVLMNTLISTDLYKIDTVHSYISIYFVYVT